MQARKASRLDVENVTVHCVERSSCNLEGSSETKRQYCTNHQERQHAQGRFQWVLAKALRRPGSLAEEDELNSGFTTSRHDRICFQGEVADEYAKGVCSDGLWTRVRRCYAQIGKAFGEEMVCW